MSEPAVFYNSPERDAELTSMKLDLDGLRWATRSAHVEAGFATNNDVKGWRLILAHDKLVRALRERFCGRDWERDDAENQEGIRNPALGIRIIAANFDELAGDPNPDVTPSNLRPKGKASWRKTRCNVTGWLPGLALPEPMHQEWQTWVLGLFSDEQGFGAELSLPLEFSENRFSKLVKRIIIQSRDDGDPEGVARMPIAPLEDIDIPIHRREG
jgi:hypothetical protein